MQVSPCLIWLFAPSALWKQKGFTFMQRKLILVANKLQLETEGVTSTDLAFNRNAWLQRDLAERSEDFFVLNIRQGSQFA